MSFMTYSYSPTPRQIRAHLDAGGTVERRATPASGWDDDPKVAERDWSGMPNQDEPFVTYRLNLSSLGR